MTNPIEALQALAGRLQHAANVLGARLDAAELDSPTGLAWARVLRELRQALEGMEWLGISQRQVEVDEARVDLMADALKVMFEALQLDFEQRKLGLAVLFQELRATATPQAQVEEIEVVRGELK